MPWPNTRPARHRLGVVVTRETGWRWVARYLLREKYPGIQPVEGSEVGALTEGLEELQSAQEAQAEFLNGLELDTDFDGEIDVEAGDAVEGDVTGALGNARDAVNAATADDVGDISADRSDAYNQAIIDEQQSVNDKALSDAQEAVDGVDGLQSDVEQLEATQADYRAAFEADAEATTELNGELAKANEVNDTASWSNSLEGDLQVVADLSTVASEGDAVITDTATSPNPVIVLGANGQLEAADGLDTSGIDGFDALLTDAQAAYDASEDLSSATTAFEDAIEAVVGAEGGTFSAAGDYYDDGSTVPADAGNLTDALTDASTGDAPLTGALLEAEAAINTFDQAVENYGSAKDNADQLASLNQDVDDANDAIQNDEDEGGLGISLLEDADNFTTEDDVYLFAESAGDQAGLSGFGDSGEDKIYFGEGYSLVELGDDAISDNVGDANAQEIFWEQAGDAVNLYVEAETFGGNSAGDADVTQVTLTGVDGADISDNLGNGFLSAGTEVA